MSEHHQGDDVITAQSGTHRSLTRRGLVAGAAALVAGLVATQAVAAGVDGDVVLGASNSTTGITRITNTTTTSGTIALALTAENGDNGVALQAVSSGTAVSASSSGSTGVTGASSSDTGFGVDGIAQNNAGGTGVRGRSFSSAGIGVQGTSTRGTGVHGSGTFGVLGDGVGLASATGAVGVQGQNAQFGVVGKTNSAPNPVGVIGHSDPSDAIGVQGISNAGIGVSGASNGNAGVFGTTTKAGFSGLAGIVSTPGTAAFAGTATIPTAFAGFFSGDVFVNGNFTVNDPTKKHGAIQAPNGDHHILYSMESPEPWLEDFGKAQLVGGKGVVQFEPLFASVVHTDDYHVFLTEYGETNGLYVSTQSATGFTVQERNKGTGSAVFSWRVVVKPKTENKAERLAKFTIPKITVPPPPAWPKPVVSQQSPGAPTGGKP